MQIKQGDMFYHKEHNTHFVVERVDLSSDMYTLFFPLGHPNRSQPWAKYSGEKLRNVSMRVVNKQVEKVMRILYGRQSNKSKGR